MSPLEIKKLKVELLNVQAAKAGLELRIEEKMDEVERIRDHIRISEAKEVELIDKLKSAEEA